MWAGSEEGGTFWGPDMGGWSPVCLSSFLQFLLSILLKHIQCIVSCQAGWGGSKTIGHTVYVILCFPLPVLTFLFIGTVHVFIHAVAFISGSASFH